MRRPRSVRDAYVAGKHVLVRADLNVPLENGRVADDTRIRASLETLVWLLDHDAAEVVVCSHLGRPDGVDPDFTIAPCADRLHSLLPDDRLRVLENTRFDEGETTNDPQLARELAKGMDLYVNDAFGSAHRAHAVDRRCGPRLAGVCRPAARGGAGRTSGGCSATSSGRSRSSPAAPR